MTLFSNKSFCSKILSLLTVYISRQPHSKCLKGCESIYHTHALSRLIGATSLTNVPVACVWLDLFVSFYYFHLLSNGSAAAASSYFEAAAWTPGTWGRGEVGNIYGAAACSLSVETWTSIIEPVETRAKCMIYDMIITFLF